MKREGSTQAEFARKHGIYKSQSQPVDGFIEASEEGDRTCIGNGWLLEQEIIDGKKSTQKMKH